MRRRSGSITPPTDTRVGLDEPCTINAQVVAEYLEGQGKPRMASFVRSISDRASLVVDPELSAVVPPPSRNPRSEWE